MCQIFYNITVNTIIFLLTEAMKLRASGEVPEPDFFGEYGKK